MHDATPVFSDSSLLESRLQRNRALEHFIGQLRLRCKNGPEDGEGELAGGAPPWAKRAKLEPAASMGADDLREELGRLGLDAEGKMSELVALLERRRNDAGEEGAPRCHWRGRVAELAGHLAESCGRRRYAHTARIAALTAPSRSRRGHWRDTRGAARMLRSSARTRGAA
jgi:hypothetical protein